MSISTRNRVNTGSRKKINACWDSDFSDGSDWGFGFNGWSRVAEKAVHVPPAAGSIRLLSALQTGIEYETTFTVSSYTDGTVWLVAGTDFGTGRTANGTYNENITCTTANKILYITVNGDADLTVDDVYFIGVYLS